MSGGDISPEHEALVSSADISPRSGALISGADSTPEAGALIFGVDIISEAGLCMCSGAMPPEVMDLMNDMDIPPESWVPIG